MHLPMCRLCVGMYVQNIQEVPTLTQDTKGKFHNFPYKYRIFKYLKTLHEETNKISDAEGIKISCLKLKIYLSTQATNAYCL